MRALYRYVDSPAATTTTNHHRLARAVASIFQCRTRTAANYSMLPQDVAGTAPEPTSRRFSPCTHFSVLVTHDPPGCRGVLLQVIHSHQLPPTLLITFFTLGANSPQSGNYFVFSQQTNRSVVGCSLSRVCSAFCNISGGEDWKVLFILQMRLILSLDCFSASATE